MNKLFTEYTLKDMKLKNRVVMPPMCMFCAREDGKVTDWHIEHYTARAAGQVGLIIVEATAIMPEGRISDNDLGIWSDEHIDGLKRLVERVHSYGSKIGIQLAHARRKSKVNNLEKVSVTDTPFSDEYDTPKELTESEIKTIAIRFKEAAARALDAGFDFIEIHAAHGYLLNVFLNPITNTRNDKWGGSRKKRFEFVKLIINEISKVWPNHKPIGIRISASDYVENGISKEDVNYIVSECIALGIDIINVSSGGVINTPIKAYPGYQIKLAENIKNNNNVVVIGGGLVDSPELAMEIIDNERSDLVYLGRALLRDPYWVINASINLNIETGVQTQYLRAYNKNRN